jgi:hypothetical protein
MGLGSLHALTPPEARAKAAQLKSSVANGIDPLAEREGKRLEAKAVELAKRAEQARLQHTFRAAAENHIAG